MVSVSGYVCVGFDYMCIVCVVVVCMDMCAGVMYVYGVRSGSVYGCVCGCTVWLLYVSC